MADELRPDRKLARHRGALLAGQEPRRRSPPADPRPQVGPRTSRPARGLQGRPHLRKAVVAGRAPGSATCAPLSLKGRSDKPRGVIRSRALWSAGTRAHAPVALRLRGAQLVPEGARSKRKPLRFPAAGDPGLRLRRGPAGRPAAHEGPDTRGALRRGRQHRSRQAHAASRSSSLRQTDGLVAGSHPVRPGSWRLVG
jgi:hypothetical protein